MSPLAAFAERLLDKFSRVLRNFVLARYRTPGGLLGRRRAQSTQKRPDNLKIRPKTPKTLKKTKFRPKPQKKINNK